MTRPTQTDLPGLRELPRFEVHEIASSELAKTLTGIEAQGGVIARMERVRARNGVWRLRVRWPQRESLTAGSPAMPIPPQVEDY